MTKITFTGQNASGYYPSWGINFPCGGTVETDNEEAIKGARSHPEFEVEEKSTTKAENPPAESERVFEPTEDAPKPKARRTRRKKA